VPDLIQYLKIDQLVETDPGDRTFYEAVTITVASACRNIVRAGAFIFLLPILFASCSEGRKDAPSVTGEHSVIEINGKMVPVFLTAEEQLNYTRSWFADIGEKRAALDAFLTLYPEKKRFCGMAALDLAYLQLGGDYRFAPQHTAFEAIKAYKDILREYEEYPEIQVKSYWYIGWIYADLLQDPEKGIEYYRIVARDYPEDRIFLLSPAPWVSIIYPDDESLQTALNTPPEKNWAALALLEIIRNSENTEEAWAAFLRLWGEYRNNVATGFALRLILEKRHNVDEALIIAREFMEKNFSNVHILGDIQKQINAINSARGSG
jgi:tetratricopeptide (TPR) repeat protein